MTKFFLRKKVGDRIANGHPWVFANELGDSIGDYKPGDTITLYSYNGSFIGKGYINPNSNIRIRLLTYNQEEQINNQFFYKKIQSAWELRKQIGFTNNCRLINAEADGLPGLIVDKYNDYLVIQIQTLGIDCWKNIIINSLKDIFSPKGIYERSDINSRKIEGLSVEKGFLTDPFDTKIEIEENGLQFIVDIKEGQRTGYFLDQSNNRSTLKNIVKNSTVLDAFCNTGSFSIHAAHYGAKEVLGLDIDQQSVNMSIANAAKNKFEHICRFKAINTFDALRDKVDKKKKYDVVILNPPSFANSKHQVDKALNGYKEINRRGMQLLKSGGILITSSCTNLISADMFKSTITEAAKDSKRFLKEIRYQSQSPDHPILWQIPTSQYLHFFILQVN